MTQTDELIHDLRAQNAALKAEAKTLRAEVSALARESVRRDIVLAKLEAEVMAIRAVYGTARTVPR